MAWLAYNKAADGHAVSEPLNKEYRGTKARCLFDLAYKSMMSQPDYYRGAGPEGATLSGYCELFRVIHRRMPNRDEFLAIGHEAFEKKKIATARAAYYLAYGVREYDFEQLTKIPADILVRLADAIIIRYEQKPEDTRHDKSFDFVYYVIPFYRAANYKPGLKRAAQVYLEAGNWNEARAILTEIGEPPDKAWYKAVAAKERPVYHYSAREVLRAGGCTEELIELGDRLLGTRKKTGETITEAANCYCDANYLPGLKKAGDAYVEAGNFRYALDCYRETRHEITDPAFFEGLAMQYLKEGEINGAQAAFKKAFMLSGGGGGGGGSSTPSPASPDGTDNSGPATPGEKQAEAMVGSREASERLEEAAA